MGVKEKSQHDKALKVASSILNMRLHTATMKFKDFLQDHSASVKRQEAKKERLMRGGVTEKASSQQAGKAGSLAGTSLSQKRKLRMLPQHAAQMANL